MAGAISGGLIQVTRRFFLRPCGAGVFSRRLYPRLAPWGYHLAPAPRAAATASGALVTTCYGVLAGKFSGVLVRTLFLRTSSRPSRARDEIGCASPEFHPGLLSIRPSGTKGRVRFVSPGRKAWFSGLADSGA